MARHVRQRGMMVKGAKREFFDVDDTATTFEETRRLYNEESPIWAEAVTSLGLAPS